ncbi:MAG: sigma-70 family RNA polymerase sigma factor [Hespellia sp.]|nr:sigma-70 family RNA polymerase sigma factor [Hespellia sp.]
MAELDYQSLNVFITRAIDGDSNAFAELYAGSYEHQYRFAYYFLKNIYDAQDALCQVYTYALKNLDTLKDTSHLIEWLEQINYRICYHMLYPAPSSPSAKAIWSLPYLESAVLIMYAYQQMSIHDIALATGRSKKLVQQLLRHAIRQVSQYDLPRSAPSSLTHVKPSRLDAKGANFLLTSILANCGYEEHSISISTFSSSHLFKKESYALQKVLLGLILCALLATPLLFVVPATEVAQGTDSNNGNRTYNITVRSLLRVKKVSAQINGQPVTVSETAKKVYTIEPRTSGSATVTVTLENGQYRTQTFEVHASIPSHAGEPSQ